MPIVEKPISGESQEALNRLNSNPFFFNTLKDIGNPQIAGKIMATIRAAIGLGEEKFNQVFGGWYPESNQFGINPLRPAHINVVGTGSNRWRWLSGTAVSGGWSNADTWIDQFSLEDEEIILIYGYFNLNPVPNTIEIQIKPGNVTLPVFNIEAMRVKNEPYFLLPQPIMVMPKSPLAIDASVKSGTTATYEEAGLLGYFFAPCSTLITR